METEDLVLLLFGAGTVLFLMANKKRMVAATSAVGQVINGARVNLPGGFSIGMTFIDKWGEAIAEDEGFYKPGSRPARNHNPGDLKFARQPGAIGKDKDGFAIFPDNATGFAALDRQLQKYVRDYPGYSLLQIMAHYLGQHGDMPTVDKEGDAFRYANFVAAKMGVPATTTLRALAV